MTPDVIAYRRYQEVKEASGDSDEGKFWIAFVLILVGLAALFAYIIYDDKSHEHSTSTSTM